MRGAAGSLKDTIARLLVGGDGVVCSADLYPPLYRGGDYQAHHQADAHVFCETRAREALEVGRRRVAIANTNMKTSYIDPYAKMARENGYMVVIVNCEAAMSPNGSRIKNAHGVPDALINSQLAGFQPWNRPTPPIAPGELLTGMKVFDCFDTMVLDLVGTLIFPKRGVKFIHGPDDFQFNSSLLAFIHDAKVGSVAIASNQLGLGNGNMEISAYQAITNKVIAELASYNIEPECWITATRRNSGLGLVWLPDRQQLSPVNLHTKLDKPNYGMIEYCARTNMELTGSCDLLLYVGDSHVPGRAEDIQLVRNIRAAHDLPFSAGYMPVEVLTSKDSPYEYGADEPISAL